MSVFFGSVMGSWGRTFREREGVCLSVFGRIGLLGEDSALGQK
jgi:hypothetical protein